MKKLTYIVLASLFALLFTSVVFLKESKAAEVSFQDNYILNEGTTVNDNLYIYGDSSEIEGTVNGDLVLMGKSLTINGTISGDVYLFGQDIIVGQKAQINGNLFILGYKTQVSGLVSSNSTVVAYSLINTGITKNDLTTISIDNVISGDIFDDLRVISSTSSVTGNVKGEAIMLAGTFDIDETKVGKKVYDEETLRQIAKRQNYDFNKKEDNLVPKEVTWGVRLNSIIIGFTSILIAGTVLIFMAPVKTGSVIKKISGSSTELLKSLGIGCLVLFFSWAPILFLLISIVGIPLAGILIAALVFTAVFGGVWVELSIGKEILELFKIKEYRPFKSFLIGRVVTTIIQLIPIIGGIYNFLLMTVALGAFVRLKKEQFEKSNVVLKKN